MKGWKKMFEPSQCNWFKEKEDLKQLSCQIDIIKIRMANWIGFLKIAPKKSKISQSHDNKTMGFFYAHKFGRATDPIAHQPTHPKISKFASSAHQTMILFFPSLCIS